MSKKAARVGVLTVVLLLMALVAQACGANSTPPPQPSPTPNSNDKISTLLLNIYTTYITTEGTDDQKKQAATNYARDQGVINSRDEVTFELTINDVKAVDDVKKKVTDLGGKVTATSVMDNEAVMKVVVPVNTFITYSNSTTKENMLADLAGLKAITNINVIYTKKPSGFGHLPETVEALKQTGRQVKNQGVKTTGVDKWQAAGFTGKGVKVAIIDLGFKYAEELRGTYLPDNFQLKDIPADAGDEPAADSTVHGAAVAEIVSSLAPDAQIYLIAFDGSQAFEEQALDYAVSLKVDIITGSFGGHADPSDGTGRTDRKVEQISKSNNILFTFAAGNEGAQHYTGIFSPDAQGFHQFIPGVTRMAIGNPSSRAFTDQVLLTWEQWKTGSELTDLDLIVEDRDGNRVKTSNNRQTSNRPPLEGFQTFKVESKQLYYLRVQLKPSTPPPSKAFRLHVFTEGLPLQFTVPGLALGAPSTSKGALAVGAIDWDKDRIAYYSSQGPALDGTFKPEISGPASVSSGAYEMEGETDFPGTSAATPQVAGVAAVLKSANPQLTGPQLRQVLLENARDLGAKGPDIAYGYGAVFAGQNPAPPQPKNNLAPSPTPNQNPNLQPTQLPLYPSPKVEKISPAPNQPSPLPTSAPDPQTTPIPVPPTVEPVSSTTFNDGFKDPRSGLPNTGSTTYQNGKYVIKTSANQLTWASYPTSQSVTDFAAEVTVQGISDPKGVYGMVFWQTDAQNYYLLSVTGQGQAQVSQYSNGSYKEIIGWSTPAPGWKAGGPNIIRLVAGSGQIKLGINNNTLGVTGKGQGSGAMGFAAASYSGAVEANFTNFRLSSR